MIYKYQEKYVIWEIIGFDLSSIKIQGEILQEPPAY